jgi:lipopolysaccharide export system protein LptA
MNSRPNQPADLSQSDADLLVHLTDLAETIEPDPTFKVDLEAKLRQAHPANLSQTAPKGTHLMNFVFPRLNRRAALVACASLAIAAAFISPTFTSGRATGWLTALFNSGIDSKANALTLAQALATGQLTITADTQESNETTQEVTAMGNAVLSFPDAQIQAKADRIQYVTTTGQFTLLGNVEISQRGENLRGSQARCSFGEKMQCSLTQK